MHTNFIWVLHSAPPATFCQNKHLNAPVCCFPTVNRNSVIMTISSTYVNGVLSAVENKTPEASKAVQSSGNVAIVWAGPHILVSILTVFKPTPQTWGVKMVLLLPQAKYGQWFMDTISVNYWTHFQQGRVTTAFLPVENNVLFWIWFLFYGK